jgi:hypothetical protein
MNGGPTVELRSAKGMSAATEDIEHPTRTQRSNFRYLFTAKHHGGDKKAAMWLAGIDRDTEFSIFDVADFREIADSRGWLYGILRGDDGKLRDIGTWNEQVAEFQPGAVGEPWYGYPKWVVNELGPPNRKKSHCRPEKQVFDRMVAATLIAPIERKRLLAGRHA